METHTVTKVNICKTKIKYTHIGTCRNSYGIKFYVIWTVNNIDVVHHITRAMNTFDHYKEDQRSI